MSFNELNKIDEDVCLLVINRLIEVLHDVVDILDKSHDNYIEVLLQ
jgi:hypothetical protein